MLRTIQKLPAIIVLALGLILVMWGGYSFFKVVQPQPNAGNESPRLCPPTIAELIGMDSAGDRLQGAVVAGIGGVAIWLLLQSLPHQKETA
jgi:hypothetical protein